MELSEEKDCIKIEFLYGSLVWKIFFPKKVFFKVNSISCVILDVYKILRKNVKYYKHM